MIASPDSDGGSERVADDAEAESTAQEEFMTYRRTARTILPADARRRVRKNPRTPKILSVNRTDPAPRFSSSAFLRGSGRSGAGRGQDSEKILAENSGRP